MENAATSESKLHPLAVGGWSGYVGRNNSWRDGDSLLVLIDALLAPYSGPLRQPCGQIDTAPVAGVKLSAGFLFPQVLALR